MIRHYRNAARHQPQQDSSKGGKRHATHERRGSHLGLPDPGGSALYFRHLRPRQRRPARLPVGAPGQDQTHLAAPRADCGTHGGRVFPSRAPPGRNADFVRPGFLQPGDGDRLRVGRFLRILCNHRQRADLAVQPRPLPGKQSQPGGRVPGLAAALRQAQLPADAGGHAAARLAPELQPDADRPSRPGQPRRAVQSVSGRGRRRDAALGSTLRFRASRCRARRRKESGRLDSRRRATRLLRRPRRDPGRGRAGS